MSVDRTPGAGPRRQACPSNVPAGGASSRQSMLPRRRGHVRKDEPRCVPRQIKDRSRDRIRTVVLPFCHLAFEGERPLPNGYPTDLRTIGDHIRKPRLDLGLLQKDVAAIIGVSVCTITNWEKGNTEPMRAHRRPIADFLTRLNGGECTGTDAAADLLPMIDGALPHKN